MWCPRVHELFFPPRRQDLAAQAFEITRHTGEICKSFVDAVDLGCRHHRLDHCHDPFRKVTVELVVGRTGHDAMAPELVLNLKKWLTHFDEGFGIGRPGDYAAIRVAEYHDWLVPQVESEHTLTAGVEGVAVDEGKDSISFAWLRTLYVTTPQISSSSPSSKYL